MVGNAEPVKEYNYRPLSKLCECQLDVNDQVSTKGWGGEALGGCGQAEMEGKEKQREREKKASTSSAASPSPSIFPCQHLPCPSHLGPDLSKPTRGPQSPTAATSFAHLHTGSGLWHKWPAPASSRPIKASSQHKEFLQNNSILHKNPARAQHSGLALRDCQTPTLHRVAAWLQVLVPSVTLSHPLAAFPPRPHHLQSPRQPCLLFSAFSVSTKLMP